MCEELKWCGHVTRTSGMAKTVLHGTVQRGRQRKRWEDNIKEWTGQDCPTGNSSRRETKRLTVETMAMSIFLYARETWTITADIERRIQALEMRCFRNFSVSRTEIT